MNDKIRIARAVKRAKTIARLIGVGLLAYGLYLSAGHITEIGFAIRLDPIEAHTLFVFIDVVALFGKLLTAVYFVARTRRIGYKLMGLGGGLSLACNIAAGAIHGDWGRAAYGAFIVGMIVLIEYATVNIKGKTINTEGRKPRAQAPATMPTSATRTWSPARRAAHVASKANGIPAQPSAAASKP
jgi:hypothetical protein